MTCVLTDIEGTTSSISFVKDVLFPYAAAALPDFLRQHAGDAEIAPIVQTMQDDYALADLESVIAQCLTWIKEDKKQTQLKALQGYIWRAGYETSAYQAHVYPDAHECLSAWKQAGHELHVYSSGSILAQELFFQYTCFGDLRPLFTQHFDTTSGPKQEAASYQNICQQLGHHANDVLFLSDIIAELDAAAESGLRTTYVRRDAAMPTTTQHQTVSQFHEIQLEG